MSNPNSGDFLLEHGNEPFQTGFFANGMAEHYKTDLFALVAGIADVFAGFPLIELAAHEYIRLVLLDPADVSPAAGGAGGQYDAGAGLGEVADVF